MADHDIDRHQNKRSEPAWEPQWDEFREHRTRVWQDQQASSDDFDKSLLTFSSGALGLSLAFIKDVVRLQDAIRLAWLYASWLFFVGCIVVTISSYAFSQAAHARHVDYLHKYYIEAQREYVNKKSIWSLAVTICAVLGAIFFLAGIIATVIFVIGNVSRMQK